MTTSPFAFNPTIASKRRNLQSEYQRAIEEILGRRNALNTEYAAKTGEIEVERPNIYRQVLNSAAGRGMAYSSGYGVKRAKADTDISSQLAALATVKDTGLADTDREQGWQDQNYQYTLADLEREQAGLQAADTKTTEALGQPPPVIPKPAASVKPVAKAVPKQTPAKTATKLPTYVIKRGDTLGAIARSNNMTVAQLARLNGINNPNMIIAGRTLRLR